MKLATMIRTAFLTAVATTLICVVANGQFSGNGTTGTTAGSGRGTGSSGVMQGTGPDVVQAPATTPAEPRNQQNTTATATTVTSETSSTKKTSSHHTKRVHKTSKRVSASPSPSAAASH